MKVRIPAGIDDGATLRLSGKGNRGPGGAGDVYLTVRVDPHPRFRRDGRDLMAEWRDGAAGAWTMGLKHGLYCAGCCWALMLLLFTAGAMNPIWIVFLTIIVAFEKWPRLPVWITNALGGILIVAGLVTLT